MLVHPKVAAWSCRECRQTVWKTKEQAVEMKYGKPLPRLPLIGKPFAPLPCHDCPKVPSGIDKVRDNAIEPSERHRKALRFHMRCRAVGRFPEDEIVESNAVVFEEMIHLRDAEQQTLGLLSVLQFRGSNK